MMMKSRIWTIDVSVHPRKIEEQVMAMVAHWDALGLFGIEPPRLADNDNGTAPACRALDQNQDA